MTDQKELMAAIAKENQRQLISGCEEAGEVNKIYGNIRLVEKKGDDDDNIFHLDEKLTWYVYALNTVTKAEIPLKGIIVKNVYADGSTLLMTTSENGKASFIPFVLGTVVYDVPGITNNIGKFTIIK